LDKDSYQLTSTPFGRLSSGIFTYGKLKNAYIWLEASGEQVTEATLKYRLEGQKKWETVTDTSYPYEFSVPFRLGEQNIEYTVSAKTTNGKSSETSVIKLQ